MTREDTAEVLLSDLERVKAEKIDLAVLKEAGVVPGPAKRAKVIVSGKLTRKVTLVGVAVSKGARAAIEAAGGSTDAPIRNPSRNASPRPYRRPSRRRKPSRARGKPALKSVQVTPRKRTKQASAARKTNVKAKTSAKAKTRARARTSAKRTGPGRKARRAAKRRWLPAARQDRKFGDLKKRLTFLFWALVVSGSARTFRLPGIDPIRLAELFPVPTRRDSRPVNMFSGGR